jgi:sugar phosphate isomerase/epimerase
MMKNRFPQAHVSVPYSLLRDYYIPFIFDHRIPVEMVWDASVLDDFPFEDFKEIAADLAKAGLSCSFHAPFLDLSLGALDSRVRQISLERMEQVAELLPLFHPRWVVCHAGFEDRHYGHEEENWLSYISGSLSLLMPRFEKNRTFLMVENVFEKDTRQLKALFRASASPWLRFCLDVGHHRLYSRTDLRVWLDDLGPVLGMLHLHDNHGQLDDHLALGQGSIDFRGFFALLLERELNPFITLEPHHEDWVFPSLEFLSLYWPWP